MTTRRPAAVRATLLVALASLLTSAHALPSGRPALTPVAVSDTGLGISVPASVDLGSGDAGSTFRTQLGPVTVTAPAGTAQWSASVTLTSAFGVRQGDQTWHLPNGRVEYLSGGATSGSISLSLCTAGQLLTSQTLVETRTAFGCAGVVSLTSWSVGWRPTLTIRTEPTDPAGTYTGTITHSVL